MKASQLATAAIAPALAAGLLAGAPSTAAAEPDLVTIKGYQAPGTPKKYNKVGILKQGPARAPRVLVLIPGTSAGAASFRVMARALLKRLKGWQIWSIERRENLLEDHSALQDYIAGRTDAGQMVGYYFDWLTDPGQEDRFTPPTPSETDFAHEWGLNVAVRDIRRVVKKAGKKDRTVVLGGHSLGGRITTAYASWKFRGKPGAKDLAGLVFIDGSGASRNLPTAADARQQLASLRNGSPFLDLVGLGLPWASGVFNALGSTLAVREPDAPSVLRDLPLLPADLKPPVPTTNLAQYAYGVDADTSPAYLALVHSNIGSLADSGDPRGWQNGELGSARRAAKVFAETAAGDGTAWYHPVRLSADAQSVNNGVRNPAQKVYGVKATLARKARVPMYGFDAALGAGRVSEATRELAKSAGVPSHQVMTVDRSRSHAHVDPLSAKPKRNAFIKTVKKFLTRKIR